MRQLAHLERRRLRHLGGDAHNGAFRVTAAPTRATLHVIASDGGGWDHVSVSVAGETRCPLWSEIAWVRDQFFEPGEAVMQLHPPLDRYVNNQAFCLHLWRPQTVPIPLPPSVLVGFTGLTPRQVARMTPAELEALRTLATASLAGTP
ncbi:hypothetical protein P3T23_009298 [Paraburkholderia sp. GAS448]|uniref:DUF7694 domain-containing protein n=1 Tax=Paraburkholderia sp. GAS448 TaxID=3035136 RepID=UPI003D1DA9D0